MRVHETAHVQSSFNAMARQVDKQVTCWKGKSVYVLPAVGFYAVTVRILAVVNATLWTVEQGLTVVPRLLVLGVSITVTEPLTPATLLKILRIWSTSLKTTVLQGASFVASMTLPELFYAQFNGEKTFFLHHVHVFIATLPDLPEVYGVTPCDPLAQTWLQLGFTNQEWRHALKLELCKQMAEGQGSGADLLDPSSASFRASSASVLVSKIIPELNRRAQGAGISTQDVQHLDCKTFVSMYKALSPQAASQIFGSRPDFEVSIENNEEHIGTVFERTMGYRFRTGKTLAIATLLLEQMKLGRDALIQEAIYTEDDIAEMMEGPLSAICTRGVYSFVAKAMLSAHAAAHVLFYDKMGNEIRITDDKQFFKMRESFVGLHRAIQDLSGEQQAALLEKIASNDEAIIRLRGRISPFCSEAKVQKAFLLLGALTNVLQKLVIHNEKLRTEDQINWHQAFYV